MSGLFATLVAAAYGQVPVATPRPRSRFEEESRASVIDIDFNEAAADPDASLAGAPASPARGPSPTAGVNGARAARDASEAAPVRPAPLLPIASASAEPDPTEARGRPAAVPGGMRARDDQRGGIPTPADIGTTRLLPAAPEPALTPEWPALEPEPLLPAAVSTAVPDEPVARSLDAGHDSLKIGRIEVRVPGNAAAPAARTTISASTRSVALPRATVRQSLDDYRASRRR